jgi:CTP:molybdopterin cytidylyltransferase MocA
MTPARHAALLLAAGGSRRLGTPKQLLEIDAEPLVRRAARALLATEPGGLYVVVGAHAEEVFRAVAEVTAERIDCHNWEEGLSASLRAGVAALPDDIDGVLVALCDQPAMDAAHLQRLIETFRLHPSDAVASAYSGVLGVPAVLPRAWFEELSELRGDLGARELLRSASQMVHAVDAPALAFDVDNEAWGATHGLHDQG